MPKAIVIGKGNKFPIKAALLNENEVKEYDFLTDDYPYTLFSFNVLGLPVIVLDNF